MENINRRGFLKGGAALAAGAALAGLAGCAPTNQKGKEEVSAQAATKPLPLDLKESDFDFSVVELEPITDFAEEQTYDIVVVGAGCAGVPAVLTAVEEGASVACLQKEAAVSANGNGASFVVNAESNPAGISRWRSSWAERNDWRINNKLFDYYVRYAEEAVPWVVAQGRAAGIEPVEYLTSSTISYDDGGIVAVCDVTQASNNDLMTALAKVAEQQGATFYYSTPCVQLVQAEDGTVTGAIGKKADGSYIKLNATKGVVLAAGDYMNNDSMVSRNLRDSMAFPVCLINHTGDGHIMGILAGGRMAPLGHARQIHTNYIGPFMFYNFLALDAHGNRFCNENIPMSSLNGAMAQTFQPKDGGIHYRIFDSKVEGGFKGLPGVPAVALVGEGSAWMDAEIVVSGNTLEELCENAGMPVEAGVASIKRYNELCAQGRDDDFGVPGSDMCAIDTPPFFCIKGDIAMSGINAGVMVDEFYRVIDDEGQPIPHLWAAGIQAGNPCGGINWNMPGGFSNAHIFTAGRYTVINALTGGMEPKNPGGFEQVSDLFKDQDGKFAWQTPEMCDHEITVW
ncbi:FAD-dependent oxidoreductase [Adlercreutzia aquisgranensis]|uniref:FAD-dependent oxidoreductase n=1 Tax=Adlercreutzia aquisgranensis TaxID=2941323 RepID=UPI00203F2A92|nr:FAD-dependent oxidoreductase [Adlercreutzia aquisgranensis]